VKRRARTTWTRCFVLACAGLVLACAGAQGRSGGPPTGGHGAVDLDGISLVELDIEPAGVWAEQYGFEVAHELTSTELAIAQSLSALPVRHAPGLSRATREIARAAPDRANVPAAMVDGLMSWAGLVDPPPRLVSVELPDDPDDCVARFGPSCRAAIDSLVAQARRTMPSGAEIEYGVGVARASTGATRMMVALLAKSVHLEPIPVAIGVRDRVELRGRLTGELRSPSIEVIDPKGGWSSSPAPLAGDRTFRAEVSCNGQRGAHQVEVLAEGAHGPEVAAIFPIYCGTQPPRTLRVTLEELDPRVSAQQVAHAIFHYLNDERRMRDLAPLEWDDRAAAVAEDHSVDMVKHGYVGHRSPRTGDVRDRFERARIRGTVLRENVARGYGPKGIHDSLMNSPGHRVNIVAADVSHVGIGVVIAPPETDVPGAPRPVFATQNFFRKPGAGAPSDDQLVPTMKARVDALRKSARLAPAQWDPGLEAIALRVAKGFARGRPPDGFDAEVFDLGYQSVETHRVESPDFDALATLDVWKEAPLHGGIGIVPVGRGDDRRFLMIVLVAVPG
jgi:uncharacterized protein YkwD